MPRPQFSSECLTQGKAICCQGDAGLAGDVCAGPATDAGPAGLGIAGYPARHDNESCHAADGGESGSGAPGVAAGGANCKPFLGLLLLVSLNRCRQRRWWQRRLQE